MPLWNDTNLQGRAGGSSTTKAHAQVASKSVTILGQSVDEDSAAETDSRSDTAVRKNDDVNTRYGDTARIRYTKKGSIKLLDQHDDLQNVIRDAMQQAKADYVLQDSWPIISSRPAFTRPLLLTAARKRKTTKIEKRVKEDASFSKQLTTLVRPKCGRIMSADTPYSHSP